jgi:hypothetical protein
MVDMNMPPMAYVEHMIIVKYDDGHSKDVTIEFMGSTLCSSVEVCALNMEFVARVTVDEKIVMLIPASVLDLETRKKVWGELRDHHLLKE